MILFIEIPNDTKVRKIHVVGTTSGIQEFVCLLSFEFTTIKWIRLLLSNKNSIPFMVNLIINTQKENHFKLNPKQIK